MRNPALLLSLVLGSSVSAAATPALPPAYSCMDDAMLVLDASGSMVHELRRGQTRIDLARSAGHEVIPHASRMRRLGLLTFGPGRSDACSNISLKVPLQSSASQAILSEFDTIQTDGGTPLSSAMEAAARALNYRSQPATMVVITDGDETCDRNPCDVARQLQQSSYDLKIHVIGIGRGHLAAASCIAKAGNGQHASADNLQALTGALRQALTCPLIGSNSPAAKSSVALVSARSTLGNNAQ